MNRRQFLLGTAATITAPKTLRLVKLPATVTTDMQPDFYVQGVPFYCDPEPIDFRCVMPAMRVVVVPPGQMMSQAFGAWRWAIDHPEESDEPA